jgi:hypothetical protein
MAVLDFCIDGSIVHGGLKVVANDDEVFCHNGVEDKRIGVKVIRASDDELIGGKVILANIDIR